MLFHSGDWAKPRHGQSTICLIAVTIIGLALVPHSSARADLVHLAITEPVAAFYGQGQITYDADTHELAVHATPDFFLLDMQCVPPKLGVIRSPATLLINVLVDDMGVLIGGVPGDDLIMTGVIDIDLNDDGVSEHLSGTLLRGEIAEWGHQDEPDAFNFAFNTSGGRLACVYSAMIGVQVASEHCNFCGSFANSFAGTAKGNVGKIHTPEPATTLLFGVGLLTLLRRRASKT